MSWVMMGCVACPHPSLGHGGAARFVHNAALYKCVRVCVCGRPIYLFPSGSFQQAGDVADPGTQTIIGTAK